MTLTIIPDSRYPETPARAAAATASVSSKKMRTARLFTLVFALATAAHPESALVAVATNFAEVMEKLEADFERTSPHTLIVTSGSTGKLYAQIRNGAPFDVLLSADQARPELLEKQGLAVERSRFTYATGRLALWSPAPDLIPADGRQILAARGFQKLAIANPDLAPYGRATRESLIALGLLEHLRPQIVSGENIGQTFALVATGNAELGFVALSYVLSPRNRTPGSRWDVPQALHGSIRQDAILLSRAKNSAAAREFLDYLKSSGAQKLIRSFGYITE